MLRKLLVAALTVLTACGPAPESPPHVVLVLVDQLRKDSADLWMPRVRELAARGVVFENVRAAAPWTYPSVISMFSGLYPQQHGADGHPLGGRQLSTFDENLPLLPKLLRGRGYHTAGFVTNPFLQTWNPFHEGFDHYEVDEFIGSQGNLRGFPEMVWTERMFADTVNPRLRAHFEGRDLAGPEFVYVHYIDVHGPWDGAPFAAGFETLSADARYEAASRWLDVRIVELYEYLGERYGDDMVFIVTSDHGQDLADDLDVGEGQPLRKKKATVHDFNLHIPLFFLPSARVTEARTVDANVSNVDLFATLLEWAGGEPSERLPARSLLPLIRGEDAPEFDGRATYAKMSAFNRMNDCVVQDEKKLMRHFDPKGRQETGRSAFDLADDPRETRVEQPSAGPAPDVLEQAAGTQGIEYPGRYEVPDEHTLENLQKMGYVGGDE